MTVARPTGKAAWSLARTCGYQVPSEATVAASLAKSVHDAGWSAFVAMLEYKATQHGRYFGRIGHFEPTSQLCSACGTKGGPKPLHVRQWTCRHCGTVHDRDVNAARNTLAAGRADRLNASWSAGMTGTKVPAQRGEAGSHRNGRTTQAGILVH